MDNTKYGKYIITELKANMTYPSYDAKYKPEDFFSVLALDDEVIKGAFTVHANWFMPGHKMSGAGDGKGNGQVKPHVHDFDEVLAVFGSDTEKPHDLNAELEFWLGDEKHVITKSCIIYLPKGLQHGPIGFKRIDRPVFQFGIMLNKEG